MSTNPTLTISIDRTGMAGSPGVLVLAASGVTAALGVTDYAEPAVQARVQYAPTSAWTHGEAALGWTYQQSLLAFSIVPVGLGEDEGREAVAVLRAALSRLSYTVTVAVDGAAAETWACDAGTVEPAGTRSLVSLRHNSPVWNVSIPAHPVRTLT